MKSLKFLVFGLIAALCASPTPALAAPETIDLQVITEGTSGPEYSFSGGVLTLSGPGPFTITTNGATVTDRRIVAASGVNVAVTLQNTRIDLSSSTDCAFDMAGATVSLTLAGVNTLRSGDAHAGIEVPAGASLTITAQSSGSLAAIGGAAGAGIGGGQFATCGTVNILGGEITATGTKSLYGIEFGGGAGIGGGGVGDGGGEGGNGGVVLINGGNVTATGGAGAAGIGAGCGDISCHGGTFTIQSGSVTAQGQYGGAGIGGGWYGAGATVTISGGSVLATGSGGMHPARGECGGAGIGGGSWHANAGTTIIEGGSVMAVGSDNAAGIGLGYNFSGLALGSVTIHNGYVRALGGMSGAGIGGGTYASGIMTTITGGTVEAMGTMGGAGIGGGYDSSGGLIAISGGTITATAEGGMHPLFGFAYGAGIGGGANGGCGMVSIAGGTVQATSDDGAAIGSGAGGSGATADTVAINGGTVTAITTGTGPALGMAGKDMALSIGGSAVVYLWPQAAGQNIATGGTCAISGATAVFLSKAAADPVATTTHSEYNYTDLSPYPHSIPLPLSWPVQFHAYLRVCEITYDANGGSGTPPAMAPKLFDEEITLPGGSGLALAGYAFGGWNTQANGNGNGYAAGNPFTVTEDVTLFAQWNALPVLTSSVSGGTVYTGGHITLTPSIPGGTWAYDSSFLSLAGNTFTALKTGTTTVTYTVGGLSTTYEITIAEAELPATGQDFTAAFVLLAAAAMVGGSAIFIAVWLRRKRAKSN